MRRARRISPPSRYRSSPSGARPPSNPNPNPTRTRTRALILTLSLSRCAATFSLTTRALEEVGLDVLEALSTHRTQVRRVDAVELVVEFVVNYLLTACLRIR